MSENKKLCFSDFEFKTEFKPPKINNERENLRNIITEESQKNDEAIDVIDMNVKIPRNKLEETIMNGMTNDKRDILLIRQKKTRIAEFDKKMKRIKQIKSRKFRKQLKLSKKSEEEELKIPEFLLKNVEEEKNAKAFYDERISEKIGKIMNIEDSSDSSATESDCDALKDEDSVEDEHLEMFKKEKIEDIEKTLPKETTVVLPGWGDWGGTGIETKQTVLNTIHSTEDGIIPKRRKDFKMGRVLINENTLQNNIKVDLPYGYTKLEYEALLSVPMTKEANTSKIFKKFLKSEEQRAENKKLDTFEYRSKYERDL